MSRSLLCIMSRFIYHSLLISRIGTIYIYWNRGRSFSNVLYGFRYRWPWSWKLVLAPRNPVLNNASRNKLESIFERIYLSTRVSSSLSWNKERKKKKEIFVHLFLFSSNETKVVDSKQNLLFLSFFFISLERFHSAPSWIPGDILAGDEAWRSSLANVEGRAERIKAGAGSGAIIQSSGQLGSIVLIAFHGGRCRQESILSLGLTLSMLHTMSFIINVTGAFQSEGSSTTAEISNPGCSSGQSIDMGGGREGKVWKLIQFREEY